MEPSVLGTLPQHDWSHGETPDQANLVAPVALVVGDEAPMRLELCAAFGRAGLVIFVATVADSQMIVFLRACTCPALQVPQPGYAT